MKFPNQKNNRGYAILFAVVIVSIISLISLGLSNTTYKQLILSSLSSDSQAAYFQADTSTECSLYADNVLGMTADTTSPWYCGLDSNGTDAYSFSIKPFRANGYSVNPLNVNNDPCFEFDVDKPDTGGTVIYARGYNSCDKTNPRTVEREIKVTYY